MNVEEWLAVFGEPLSADAASISDAAALVKFSRKFAGHFITVIDVRRKGTLELVVLDFRTGRPQQSAYPIKSVERVGVLFSDDGLMPLVLMLRDDFPDTEHQQLIPEGFPKAICIDDRSWEEARLTWTPAELVQRILSWFGRAARGELHDSRQPIDPILFGSMLTFILPRSALETGDQQNLIAIHQDDRTLKVVPFDQVGGNVENTEPICLITYRVPPARMTRMTYAPTSLGSLAELLRERDIDLFGDLRTKFDEWLNVANNANWRMRARFAVIVEMPIVDPAGAQQQGSDVRAFVTAQATGEIAVALGVAHKDERHEGGNNILYHKALTGGAADEAALNAIETQPAEVHLLYDRKLATRLSGRDEEDDRQAVIVGAGAIGSHIIQCLSREGRFTWTIIDDDQLLPHNLARHTAGQSDIMRKKSELVAESVSRILVGPNSDVRHIPANVFKSGDQKDRVDEALNDAGIIIDASASVAAARFVSDHGSNARRISAFFNPQGDAAVLLAEPADRSVRLRDLEAQYLGKIASDPTLSGHLSRKTEAVAYTGACRAITNVIPESNVMALSGLVARGIGKVVDENEGLISIWSLTTDGSVSLHSAELQPVETLKAGQWSVTIDAGLIARIREMREQRLPNETGGILFGLVDIPEKSIHLVGAAPAPPDSEESAGGFVRGTQGVAEEIERVTEQTRGQVRYVGEWHSHPPRAGARPSTIDLVQIDWLSALFDMDTLPALMLIAADNQISIAVANVDAAPADERSTEQEGTRRRTGS